MSRLYNNILSGILFVIPLFFVAKLTIQIWQHLREYGEKMARVFDIKTFAGVGFATIATTLLLVLLFYVFGLLIRYAYIGSFRNWIENNMLEYIPGYINFKVKVEEKILKLQESCQPVLLETPEGGRPALLIETVGDLSTLFIPNCPDTDIGQVVVVANSRFKKMDGTARKMLQSVQFSGRGLAEMVG